MDIFKLREEYLKKNNMYFQNVHTQNIFNNEIKRNEEIKIEEPCSENVNELFEILSKKINNIEMIDETLIIEIYRRLKFIRKNHNAKIVNWYDEKYYYDLNEFKINNENFGNLMKFYESNSFISIDEN